MDNRAETKGRSGERMPERPAWCSPSRWNEYKWKATAPYGQGAANRRKLAAEYGLPVIPASVLSI